MENKRVKIRSKTLLCLKETHLSKTSYIKTMGRFNRAISAAFAARFIPPLAPYAKAVHKSTMRLQQIYHFSILKNPIKFKFCPSLIKLSYFKTLPYKTRGKIFLLRRLDGTVPIREPKWREYIWSKDLSIVFQNRFHLSNRFASSPKTYRRELSKEALLRWKESFGSRYSSSLASQPFKFINP